MQCGVDNWQALPVADTGEHYCPTCCTIWTPDGAIKNVPTHPVLSDNSIDATMPDLRRVECLGSAWWFKN